MTQFDEPRNILAHAARNGAFACAVVEVGRRDGVMWQQAFGTLNGDPCAPPTNVDTVFDLASLTKVLATTTLAMIAVDRRLLQLTDPVRDWLREWRGSERVLVTVQDLLEHASGLTAHLAFFRDHRGRVEFERAICILPLEYTPRSQSVYSDLGFLLLGFICEDAFGSTLDVEFQSITAHQQWGDLSFRPPSSWRDRTAPTELDPWRGRLLVGEVHDENAWALGGVAGHSGLFGTVSAVGSFARTIMEGLGGQPLVAHPDTLSRFVTRSNVRNSSRALGWDTMRQTSSCGTQMSPAAIGHTGFTGTSLWIDPGIDAYVVLLTNRVYPTRANEAILQIRPALHNAVMGVLRD